MPAGAVASGRFDRLDAVRGVAIVWMALFHFAFDLNLFGWIEPRQHFLSDPLWTVQRTLILSLFLLCAGAGQAVAQAAGQSWPRFWRRWAQIVVCALAVSIGSSFMFPQSWIGFGVLHGIAVMLVIVRLTARWGAWLWLAGAVAVALPQFVAHPFFNAPWAHWVGLVTRKPVTEDWVPVLPWLGVMWWGCAAAQWLLARRRQVLAGPVPGPAAPLATLGRWSLTFYMLHQPVFIGALMAWRALFGQA